MNELNLFVRTKSEDVKLEAMQIFIKQKCKIGKDKKVLPADFLAKFIKFRKKNGLGTITLKRLDAELMSLDLSLKKELIRTPYQADIKRYYVGIGF